MQGLALVECGEVRQDQAVGRVRGVGARPGKGEEVGGVQARQLAARLGWAGGQDEGAVLLFLPITAIFMLLISYFLDEPREWSRRSLAEALFLGVATYAAYMLWDNAMRKGNIVMVAAASYLTPLFSTIVSCLYLAVVPGARLWVGCGVLVLGSILSWQSMSNDSTRKIAQPAVARDGS